MSLSTEHDIFETMCEIATVIPYDQEAARLLLHCFVRCPEIYVGLIISHARDHVRRCDLAKHEPNALLLNTIDSHAAQGEKDYGLFSTRHGRSHYAGTISC